MLPFIPEPEPVLESDAPRNYKKAEAIRSWMEREAERRRGKREEEVEKMALDVDYARVVAFGHAPDDAEIFVELAIHLDQERDLLEHFWWHLSECRRLCGGSRCRKDAYDGDGQEPRQHDESGFDSTDERCGKNHRI